jgi:copper chaperone NosL
MKRKELCCLLVVFCLLAASSLWAVDKDVSDIPACKYCGMNREMFAHSRMVIDFSDGTSIGTCSLHCTAVALAVHLDSAAENIRAADYGTKELIDAKTAVWIIGGSKPGVMTKNAKWAFAKKEDAEKFQKENGGQIASFDEALETAYKDLGRDTNIIREKRKMKKDLKKKEMQHNMQHDMPQ